MKALRTLGLRATLVLAVALNALGCTSDTSGATAAVTTDYALRNELRALLTEHGTWTRAVIIDMAAGLPDTAFATQRLLRNQVEVADALRPYLGDAVADALRSRLIDHVTGLAALINAAKSADGEAIAARYTEWYANADQVAALLAEANPRWPRAELTAMLRAYLDQTLVEAEARLTMNWRGDVAAHDALAVQALKLADALAAGVTAGFPYLVATSTMPQGSQGLHRAMRARWHDQVAWTRFALIDALAGLPAAEQSTARLLQQQDDLGDAFKPYYGEESGGRLASLLRDHITGAAALIFAANFGDESAVEAARVAWYANADQIAALLAAANPHWSQTELEATLRAHLDRTLAQAEARAAGDWALDVTTYDALVRHVLELADALSEGIARQFPDRVR